MRKIYCKSTETRRRKFQIYTSIVKQNGKKYVIKEAVYQEGKEHITHIFNNYIILNRLHPGKVVGCERIEEKLYFPFLEGLQYEETLLKIFTSECDEDEWKKILSEWKQLIIGRAENIVPFDNNEKFQKIFGDGQPLLGNDALRITNFDCIPENIIITTQGPQFIDYEWIFEFPIPLELCIYRVLKIFSLKNKIPFLKILKILGFTDDDKIKIYERMLDSFNLYISYEEAEGILYSQLGKVYKEPKILSEDRDKQIKFEFPMLDLNEDSSIILYGAGEVGRSYHKYLEESNYILAGWVDKHFKQYRQFGYDVYPVENIFETQYDYILLAIYNDKTAREIIAELMSKGVIEEKIIWKKPRHI